jgi:hypothetical protein
LNNSKLKGMVVEISIIEPYDFMNFHKSIFMGIIIDYAPLQDGEEVLVKLDNYVKYRDYNFLYLKANSRHGEYFEKIFLGKEFVVNLATWPTDISESDNPFSYKYDEKKDTFFIVTLKMIEHEKHGAR